MLENIVSLVKPALFPALALGVSVICMGLLASIFLKVKSIRVVEKDDCLEVWDKESGTQWQIDKSLTVEEYHAHNSVKKPPFGKVQPEDMELNPLSDAHMIMSNQVGAYLLLTKIAKGQSGSFLITKHIIEYCPLKRRAKLLDYEKKAFMQALNRVGYTGSCIVDQA